MDLFMDCSRVVDNGRLNGLPLDDRLNSFVDMVVLMLVNMGSQVSMRLLDIAGGLLVAVHSSLLLEGLLVLGKHLLLMLTDDGRGSDINMLGVQSLLVLYGLNSVLVMVNVPFTVNSLNTFSVLLGPDMLLDDFGSSLRANLGGVWLGRTLEEVLNALSNRRCVWF